MLSVVETSLKITFSCGRRGTAFAVVEELLEFFISFIYITKWVTPHPPALLTHSVGTARPFCLQADISPVCGGIYSHWRRQISPRSNITAKLREALLYLIASLLNSFIIILPSGNLGLCITWFKKQVKHTYAGNCNRNNNNDSHGGINRGYRLNINSAVAWQNNAFT